MMESTANKRVAVIGGGISGISAAYNLHKFSNARIKTTIYECSSRLGGGHLYTVNHPNIARPIDIGLQVYSGYTHPTFKQFLQELGVQECSPSMSISVETEDGFSWSSKTLNSLSSFWRQPLTTASFAWGLSGLHSKANHYITQVESSEEEQYSISEFAKRNNIGQLVMDAFLIPVIASIWSVEPDDAEDCDAYTIFKFMNSHNLLSFTNKLPWKACNMSSQDYITKFLTKCQPRVRTSVAVEKLSQDELGRWSVNGDISETYEHVVLAGDYITDDIEIAPNDRHVDDVERLLRDLTGVQYAEKIAVVHTDDTVMPSDRHIWSSVNFKHGIVTYWENSLQPIGDDHDVFVSILTPHKLESVNIDPSKRLCPVIPYRNPQGITESPRTSSGQGAGGLYICGEYETGFRFNEDGYRSGVNVASAITGREQKQAIIRHREYPQFSSLVLSPLYYFLDSVFKSQLGGSIHAGCIGIQVLGGEMTFYGESNVPSAVISVNSYSMMVKCLLRGEIGFTEAYMDGNFTTDNLPLLIFYLLQNRSAGQKKGFIDVITLGLTVVQKLSYIHLSKNSLSIAKKNISDHYDLGNDFFASFLDETMTYSSGIFAHESCTLKEAQLAKYERLCSELGITKHDHVLEIGTGWGGFACHVVRHTGCKVTTITLSHQQAVYAQKLVQREGLNNSIEVIEMDYRHIPAKLPSSTFDVVVSIEMIEAVGPANYDEYFNTIRNCSSKTARVGLQAITRFEDNYEKHKRSPDFINQYIFPGGCLPSLGAISQHASRNGLVILSTLNIAKDYAVTLGRWRHNFLRAAQEPDFPYDTSFRRKWDMYFAMCQAAFQSGTLQDYQIILKKLDYNPLKLVNIEDVFVTH